MNTRVILTLTLWMGLLGSSPAGAAIIAFWQQVAITPAAIADDPALANMQCWDLMVTTTGNWNAALLAAHLPTGMVFYKHPLGGFTLPDPALVASAPALEFTTYVSSPSEDGTNHVTIVIGGHPQSNPPNLGNLSGRFSMAWGDFITDPPGEYQIARLTFPQGVLPQVFHPVGEFSVVSQGNPSGSAVIPDIPEPPAFGLLAFLGLLPIRKRMDDEKSPAAMSKNRARGHFGNAH